jgi:tetratricopeptide (TPR) repeat protein
MRIAALAVATFVALSACGRPPLRALPPAPDLTPRLNAADALLRAGCFDCLSEAFERYTAIIEVAGGAALHRDAALAGAVRAALLLELRSRELGLPDDGYLQRAHDLLAAREELRAPFLLHLATVNTVPRRAGRFDMPLDAAGLRQMQEVRASYAPMAAERRASADDDALSAYAWIAFVCTHGIRDDRSPAALTEPLVRLRDAPIVAYRLAVCGGADSAALTALTAREPRYREISFWLGQAAVGRAELQEAESHLIQAYEWRPRWPAVTAALGDVHFAFEEPARALDFYEQTLALSPDHPDALLGRIKALSVAGRHERAFSAIDVILDGPSRVFPGEAYYWRAWNNAQLGRVDEAWLDIEQAARLWVNSEVSKLSGVIAYRRRMIVDARERFQSARKLAPDDCETLFYLGSIHSELRAWAPSIEVFADTVACFERARSELESEVRWVQESGWSEERKSRHIARRETQLATAERLTITAWFNMAAAHFNLGNGDDARRYAELVVDDEQFAVRARELLNRLARR